MEIDIVEKLYRVVMLKAVEEGKATKKMDGGGIYWTKIGRYYVNAKYYSGTVIAPDFFELNYVRLIMKRRMRDKEEIISSRIGLDVPRYSSLFGGDSTRKRIDDQLLKQEFVFNMSSRVPIVPDSTISVHERTMCNIELAAFSEKSFVKEVDRRYDKISLAFDKFDNYDYFAKKLTLGNNQSSGK